MGSAVRRPQRASAWARAALALALLGAWSPGALAQEAPPDPDPGPGPEEPAPPEAPAEPEPTTPLAQLEAWAARYRAEGRWWAGARLDLRRLTRQVQAEAEASPEALARVANLLLDLGSDGMVGLPLLSHFAGGSDRQRTRREAFNAVSSLLEGELGPRLTVHLAEVLAMASSNPEPRRHLAAYLASTRPSDAGRLALLSVARDGDDPLRPAALKLLTRWPDEAVDLFLVRQIGREFDRRSRPHPFNILLERVQEVGRPLGSRAAQELRGRLKVMLLSADWREAARAIELSVGLDPKVRVPLLIDALSSWERRRRKGTGSLRVTADVTAALQGISGRSLGSNPNYWVTWWLAVQEGQTPLNVERQDRAPRSRSSFFGLRPQTDRVTFIIDISGSMETRWGSDGHSRYVEAVEQLMRFLQGMGEQGRFNVILFSSTPLRSSPHLVRADAETLQRARDSLLGRSPGGGTNLRPAVELALRLGPRGEVVPERLEADTIVILCDGETAGGKGWVGPLFDRIQSEAQVRIHCVLLGTQGDGTLEALAQATGGEFLRVD